MFRACELPETRQRIKKTSFQNGDQSSPAAIAPLSMSTVKLALVLLRHLYQAMPLPDRQYSLSKAWGNGIFLLVLCGEIPVINCESLQSYQCMLMFMLKGISVEK